jgi:hypothetical protein
LTMAVSPAHGGLLRLHRDAVDQLPLGEPSESHAAERETQTGGVPTRVWFAAQVMMAEDEPSVSSSGA